MEWFEVNNVYGSIGCFVYVVCWLIIMIFYVFYK